MCEEDIMKTISMSTITATQVTTGMEAIFKNPDGTYTIRPIVIATFQNYCFNDDHYLKVILNEGAPRLINKLWYLDPEMGLSVADEVSNFVGYKLPDEDLEDAIKEIEEA